MRYRIYEVRSQCWKKAKTNDIHTERRILRDTKVISLSTFRRILF